MATTTCVMDCPDTCALEIEVRPGEGGAPPQVVSIGGAAEHPTTRGYICGKVARYHERLDHPDRLLHPMRRVGAKGDGRFERISWEDAIELVAGRLAEIRDRSGGEAILPFHYGGSNGLLADGLVDDLLWARLGASKLEKTICAAPTTEVARAMYGRIPGVAYEDYPEARAIVLWGVSPKTSGVHLVPFLHAAKKRGAFLAVVDPRRTFNDGEADLHLPILPGSDLPVALAMARRWERAGLLDRPFLDRWADGLDPLLAAADGWPLDRAAAVAGVEADAIARLADAYAEGSPAVVRTGWGLERNVNGGRAIAAILALPALLGKFGVRGGGYTMSNRGQGTLDTARVLGDVDWRARSVNMTRLGAWLTAGPGEAEPLPGDPDFPPDPPVEALFVYNANPAATVPDQRRVLAGLARDDLFTVVFEQVMTDTARWADVLLPAATFLEHWEVRVSYGAYGIGGGRPAIPPRGESRPNHDVFAALGRALGFTDAPFGWDERTAFDRVVEAVRLVGKPVDAERLAAGLWVRPDFPGENPIQLGPEGEGGVPPWTPDRKIHLSPPLLGPDPFVYHPPAARWPLALISPASRHRISSTLGEIAAGELTATLHPADAAARGIHPGDEVRLYNELGEVRCAARVSDRLRPGVVELPKGAWRRDSRNGMTATALAPDTINEVAAGACFNDARVEVELAAAALPAAHAS